jgi:2,4-dienoyl-CoA reductase-like NADH-dependent reductase (Old Yellow Enzyme family)
VAVYLLHDVEKFLYNKNVSAARFGREVMGDPRFVFDLRNGREPRARTEKRVRAYLEQAQ